MIQSLKNKPQFLMFENYLFVSTMINKVLFLLPKKDIKIQLMKIDISKIHLIKIIACRHEKSVSKKQKIHSSHAN